MRAVENRSGPPPTAAPASSAGSAKQSYDQEQQYRTKGRVDDRTDHSGAQMNAEPRQKPIADKGAHDPDKKVANNPKASPTNDLADQPSRDDANQNDDQQALV